MEMFRYDGRSFSMESEAITSRLESSLKFRARGGDRTGGALN